MPLPTSIAGFKKEGKFYTTKAPTDLHKVKELVTALHEAFTAGEPKKLVWILSGTHGDKDGNLVRERKFFWDEDKALEGQTIKSVDVFHFTKDDGTISTNSWNKYLGANAIVILAWCYSEQSRTGWMKKAHLSV